MSSTTWSWVQFSAEWCTSGSAERGEVNVVSWLKVKRVCQGQLVDSFHYHSITQCTWPLDAKADPHTRSANTTTGSLPHKILLSSSPHPNFPLNIERATICLYRDTAKCVSRTTCDHLSKNLNPLWRWRVICYVLSTFDAPMKTTISLVEKITHGLHIHGLIWRVD